MKLSYKDLIILSLVILALFSLFLPMLWERNLYPTHLIVRHHAERLPTKIIKKMPTFSGIIGDFPKENELSAWGIMFADEKSTADALTRIQTLQAAGYSAYLAQGQTPSDILVMVGPFIERNEAEKVLGQLNETYHVDASITTYKPTDIKEVPVS
jgi:hypothetical protein